MDTKTGLYSFAHIYIEIFILHLRIYTFIKLSKDLKMKNEETKSDEPKKSSTLGDRMNSGLLRPENGEYDLSKAVIPEGLIRDETGKLIKRPKK